MHALLIAASALLFDRLLGELRRFHPLSGFGGVASFVEARLRNPASAPWRQKISGLGAGMLLLPPIVLLSQFAVQAPVAGIVAEILLLYLTLGGQSLSEHAQRVAAALRANDLGNARQQVSMIVSRDTAAMQPDDVARAAVESVLENGNDAVFGALFWFAIAGAPGAVFYRLANTLDAMWGYRNERFLHFGWAAARLDDLLNYLPARLTALTYALLGRTARSWRCWRRQGMLWDSPNAGPVMAAGAGALGIALGGPAFYHGANKVRPVLGEGAAATGDDIERALRLVRYGVLLWLAAGLLLALGGQAFA